MQPELAPYLERGAAVIDVSSPLLTKRPAPAKWSAQEILGHLIDSARYNLQRFTEILLSDGVYQVVRYPQDGLVRVNHYQQGDITHLLGLWKGLNTQIATVFADRPAAEMEHPVRLPDGELVDLQFLLDDYLAHGMHHLSQIEELLRAN